MIDNTKAGGFGFSDDKDNIPEMPSSMPDSYSDIDTKPEQDEIDYLRNHDFRPKLLITGAKGQLGVDLAEVLNRDFNVMLTDIEEMDITSPDDVISTFTLYEPDIVVHAAAYTNVDGAESNQKDCFRINAIGTQNVALACQDCNSRMVYISTDYVFDGNAQKPYREYMHTSPSNVYGESKLMGEQIVKQLTRRHFIVRTSWLFGVYGKNFVKTMLNLSTEKSEINVVDDQWGRPTYTRDLAQAIAHLVNSPFYGTYHISNPEPTTWCRFAHKIFELAGRDTKVNAITTSEYPTPAKRPKYSVLDSFYWELRGFPPLRSWEDSLREFLEHPVIQDEFPFLNRDPKEP